MPPGGFRLAIVNCIDLDAGRAARTMLRTALLQTSAARRITTARTAERAADSLGRRLCKGLDIGGGDASR